MREAGKSECDRLVAAHRDQTGESMRLFGAMQLPVMACHMLSSKSCRFSACSISVAMIITSVAVTPPARGGNGGGDPPPP